MSDEQTMKEILKERLTPGEHIPLYNPEALKRIEKEFDRWKNRVVGEDLLKAAEKARIKEHTVFLLGGIFPPENASKLKEMGFSATFLSATKEEIISCIESALASKKE